MSFEPVKEQFYRLVAKHSGKVVEIHHDKLDRGTPIQQGDWVNGEYQQFKFHRNGGFYNIVARTSGRSFDVPRDSQDDGVGIIQWDRHDHSHNQQFALLPAGGGTYFISARHSEKFLCMKDGGKDYGVPVVQQTWNGGDHFHFMLVPCEPYVSGRAVREIALRGADSTRDAVLSLVGMIPKLGGGVKYLLSAFWEDPAGSPFERLRDYVREVAKQLIDEEYVNTLAKHMDGIKKAVKQYSMATEGADKGGWMTNMLGTLDKAQPYFLDRRAPEKTLPHLITLGTMHLSALRERYDNFEKLYSRKSDRPEELLANLQETVQIYADAGKTAREKTLEWRLAFVTLYQDKPSVDTSRRRDFHVADSYEGFHYVTDDSDMARAQATAQLVFEERKRLVKEAFSAELDALFAPALLWKYINPTLAETPKTVRVTTSSALFGTRKGTEFAGEIPSVAGLPLKEVGIYLNAANNSIQGLYFNRGSGPLSRWGLQNGDLRTHRLSDGEFITAAYGTHEGPTGPLRSLYFVTNKGHIVGGGRRNIGTPWGSEAPIGSDTRLETVFGWAKPAQDGKGSIEGIGFKWSYARKE